MNQRIYVYTLRINREELEMLEKKRGKMSKSVFLRKLIKEAP